MSRTSRYGNCIEQFDVDMATYLRPTLKFLIFVYLPLLVLILTGDRGWHFGPYTSWGLLIGTGSVAFFGLVPMLPNATCLRACSNGIVFRTAFISLFIPWNKVRGFETEDHEAELQLILLVDPSVGIGRRFNPELKFRNSVTLIAARLSAIRETCLPATQEADSA